MSEEKNHILGYGYMLENEILTEFKRIYPNVLVPSAVPAVVPAVVPEKTPEVTERPTIDVTEYRNKSGKVLNTNSIGASYFKAEPGFRPKPKAPLSRKIVSFIDIDGLIRYKYE
jgi:hypothetical protein